MTLNTAEKSKQRNLQTTDETQFFSTKCNIDLSFFRVDCLKLSARDQQKIHSFK